MSESWEVVSPNYVSKFEVPRDGLAIGTRQVGSRGSGTALWVAIGQSLAARLGLDKTVEVAVGVFRDNPKLRIRKGPGHVLRWKKAGHAEVWVTNLAFPLAPKISRRVVHHALLGVDGVRTDVAGYVVAMIPKECFADER